MPDFLFYPLLFALGGLLFVNFEILIRGNSYKGTFSAGGIYLWFVYSVFIKTSLPHIIKLFVAVGTAVTLMSTS